MIHTTDVLYQVSLLHGLASGDYQGSVTVGDLKQHGDIGLGTFDRLNGELILLDGVVYRASGDGRVEEVSDEETIPFAVAGVMEADETKRLREVSNLDMELDGMVREYGRNRFYLIRIDGMFRTINVRSVPAQEKPYRRLAEVLATEQTVFDYENIEGTIVGVYCPPYLSQLNAVGWHMHFISKDKTKGGHVLGVCIDDAVLTLRGIDGFKLQLPQNEMFSGFDLTLDRSAEIEKIETNR